MCQISCWNSFIKMTSPSNVLFSGKRQQQQRNPINKLIPLFSAERERERPLLVFFSCICYCIHLNAVPEHWERGLQRRTMQFLLLLLLLFFALLNGYWLMFLLFTFFFVKVKGSLLSSPFFLFFFCQSTNKFPGVWAHCHLFKESL